MTSGLVYSLQPELDPFEMDENGPHVNQTCRVSKSNLLSPWYSVPNAGLYMHLVTRG